MRFFYMCFFASVFIISCAPAKPSSSEISAKKPQPKIILPQQPVSTPSHIRFISDNEGLFTPREAQKLDSLVRTFEKSNLISIKLVTVTNPAITKENFDQYNKELLEEWGALHGNSSKCIAISISKKLRQISIDTGPFVQQLLSENETQSVIEHHFKPLFRQQQFYQGTVGGLNGLMDTIRKNIKW